MKLVAVSQRVDEYPERHEVRDAIDQRLITFISVAGFNPIPVPNHISVSSDKNKRIETLWKWIEQIGIEAIVLSGGNDIGEYLERDETENWLLDYAEKLQLPVLGICRGMQMLGIKNKGKLNKIPGHVCTNHEVSGKLSRIVNSYHAFCFTSCPKDYEILAMSSDGCIEAMRHKKLPWEGWMWHPERCNKFKEVDIDRIQIILGDRI